MRYAMAVAIGTVLLIPALSSGKAKPSGKGYIVLDAKCDVAATDLDIVIPANTPAPTVEWIVFNEGCTKAKVAVGIFRAKADSKYYPLLSCPGVQVGPKKTDIKCTFNTACLLADYAYGVCVDGVSVFDPELRIKGSLLNPAGTCTGSEAKKPSQDVCERASR